MARTRRTNTNGTGGLLGSFTSMFGFHQVNICKTEDNTFYCNFMGFLKLL